MSPFFLELTTETRMTEPQCLEKARPENYRCSGDEEEKDRTEPKDVLKHGKKTIQVFAFFCFGWGWN